MSLKLPDQILAGNISHSRVIGDFLGFLDLGAEVSGAKPQNLLIVQLQIDCSRKSCRACADYSHVISCHVILLCSSQFILCMTGLCMVSPCMAGLCMADDHAISVLHYHPAIHFTRSKSLYRARHDYGAADTLARTH